ncbi:flagellar protein FlbB [Leptospira wolffii]|uniref:periplasmic-type flagellar collar protein FlbB n=1 Tax=Leptospira wolffii TaxID=409998 RepID=UPI00034BCBDD|nr:flagellar protein FlbB [Leptospira wolffii]TGK60106.1 flagellar protein FlbB [Leptospira wolffii]TGK72449.1 flagellar protein FlbB [Leptospira wolffii]TGK76113.1 flagellar protein FlbB [Leptospira wolffii]TGL30365.1 flagellar protein FlbB [Leptospira wolffii]
MASLTDKARAVYLVLLIFFLVLIGFFAFDYFQIINASEIFPFLSKEPGLVNPDSESPSELEKLEFRKEMERLAKDRDEIAQKEEELKKEKERLEAELEKIEELKRGLVSKENELKSSESEKNSRGKLVKVMAEKVANMPPDNAVQMLINWPDKDIIDVFIQMDKDAEQDGRQTITTYLLTLFPADRRATITNKWLSRSDVIKAPESSPESEEL